MDLLKEGFLETGKIVAIQALKGEVRVQPWCDSPEFLAEFDELYLDGEWVEVERARVQKTMVVMKFAGIDTPEAAQKLVGKVLYLHRDQAELEEGSYFVTDLIGMEVVDADDPSIVYGKLTDVTETGANDIYHGKFPDGKTRYVPAIPQVIDSVDVANKRMTIRPMEGLFE